MCHNIQGSPPTRLAGNQIFFVFFNNIAVFPQKIFCGLWPRALCSLPGDTAAVGWLKGVGNGFSPHNGSQFDPMQSVPSPRLGVWSCLRSCDRFMSKSVGQPGALACGVGPRPGPGPKMHRNGRHDLGKSNDIHI